MGTEPTMSLFPIDHLEKKLCKSEQKTLVSLTSLDSSSTMFFSPGGTEMVRVRPITNLYIYIYSLFHIKDIFGVTIVFYF